MSQPATEQSNQLNYPVAMISMPFASFSRPSLQLGLLKSIISEAGFPIQTFHFNLNFAQKIGLTLYDALSRYRGRCVGDWLFSVAAFGKDAPDPNDCFLHDFENDIKQLIKGEDALFDLLQQIRHQTIPDYIDEITNTTDWKQFRVVGFTSTFQQNSASFALARRIKQAYPEVCIFFGGANFEGVMGEEWIRSINWIDYALIGEGDQTVPEFLVALHDGKDPTITVPGVIGRREGAVTTLHPRTPLTNLDALPIPDFDEFFERAERLELLPVSARRVVEIPFESSRGCWWGQRSHCTFCGLNGTTLQFRTKSPERVLQELAVLSDRYRSFNFEAVDNILDLSYLDTVFPQLIQWATDYEFFYEVKSNLSREHLMQLYRAGVRTIQPGIESLNSHVLKLMRKGVSAIQNVNLLRWSQYYGIKVAWNLLWGFPGEIVEDYQQQLDLLKSVVHLQPPNGAGRIWMERYSPLFFDRQSFPVRFLCPEASYSYIYPKYVALDRIAYFFDYELEGALHDSIFEETAQHVSSWQECWKKAVQPTLKFWFSPGLLQIEDHRNPSNPGTFTFRDELAKLYRYCSNQPQSAAKLKTELGLQETIEEIEICLNEFCARGLMMRDGKQFLSLALPATGGR
jgi:ribosomal peptide maturation radical SAM protein 1